ncbi:MAG: GspE/PulE family protein [Gemmatimonadetes bacterium]|nr:GspE/PulE family protein [Gemmatimonadota bacterium]
MTGDPLAAGARLRAAAASPLAARFPRRWLEEHAVLPLAVDSAQALVAADGPLPAVVRDTLERGLGAEVAVAEHAAGAIRAALVAEGTRAVEAAGVAGEGVSADRVESVDDLRALAAREPVVQVVNALLAEAVRMGASDLHLETLPDGVRVRVRLDGVLRDLQQLGADFRLAVLSRLKVLAGLDIAERRLPQDGRARIRVAGREVDLRVATLPALHGESLVVRLLDGSGGAADVPLDALGFSDAVVGGVRRLVAQSSGLVLVSGPTGSGKTTTLHAALRWRSTPGVKVVTVEDPVEYRLDGVVQLPVNPRAGFTFANALRAILRHDPDVILVGELRDAETAALAVQAALTGHLVLSTVHTVDATAALTRLADMGVAPYLLAATVRGVLAQRLVRGGCPVCAAPRAPSAEEAAMLAGAGMGATTVVAGAGCPACAGTGYRGRVALGELLMPDDALRGAFVAGASLGALRAQVRASGVPSLRADGMRLVADGRTTVEEVLRVVGDGEEA